MHAAHLAFAATVVLIPLTTWNRHLLHLHVFVMVVTIATRKHFGGCMLSALDGDANATGIDLDWDLLFPALATVSLLKLSVLAA